MPIDTTTLDYQTGNSQQLRAPSVSFLDISPLCHAWGREQGSRGVALISPASTWWMAYSGFAHPEGALFRNGMA